MVVAKSMSKPGPRAITKLKRVLRYLEGTVSIGITYSKDADDGDKLTAYVDSYHAGDQDEGYSTTGIVLYFAGGPVDWRSTKQTGGGHLNGRIRICRHVQGGRDDLALSELVGTDE